MAEELMGYQALFGLESFVSSGFRLDRWGVKGLSLLFTELALARCIEDGSYGLEHRPIYREYLQRFFLGLTSDLPSSSFLSCPARKISLQSGPW
jgi:hypothetical protein